MAWRTIKRGAFSVKQELAIGFAVVISLLLLLLVGALAVYSQRRSTVAVDKLLYQDAGWPN
ncbi:hypothetical protein [Massilia glaciei]|uniref:Uncharacterized protein n=1 Tax=Massilia glaciei TaxID=1524097 RepID=A0A2U2HFY6_9BURK|nr:hypothetical protein [Massilia glaciei]PWF43617.1 hypothetical protein C7C56_021010 [Massilia glaciei]